jgi:hypothetical protein
MVSCFIGCRILRKAGVGFVVIALTACATGDGQSYSRVRDVGVEKASRSEAEQKISSDLLDALDHLAGDPGQKSFPGQFEIDLDEIGRVLVDIQSEVSQEILAEIEQRGGQVISAFPQYGAIRARVPLKQLPALAQRSEVKFIRSAAKAMMR